MATCILVVGCAKTDSSELADKAPQADLTSQQVNALRYQSGERSISRSEVISYAEFAMATLDSNHPTRSGKRSIEALSPVVEQTTRSQEGDTTMYIVNFADSMGYAIISSDVLAPGPIAIIENGSLGSLEQATDNAALNLALRISNAKRQSLLTRQNADTQGVPILSKGTGHYHPATYLDHYYKHTGWTKISSEVCLRTSWSNYVGFAVHCPRIASCDHFMDPTAAAAALAQLAYYYRIGGYTWSFDMEKFRGITNVDFVSDESINTIRDLYANICNGVKDRYTYQCTNSLCPNYGFTNAHWTSAENQARRMFNISQVGYLLSDIQNKRPGLMSGLDRTSDHRHYWVVDGYALTSFTCSRYNRMTGLLVPPEVKVLDYMLVHCKMGLTDGYGDGYYEFDAFSIDSPIVRSGADYSYDIQYLSIANPLPIN